MYLLVYYTAQYYFGLYETTIRIILKRVYYIWLSSQNRQKSKVNYFINHLFRK